jgi:serine/threonine protein kinase
MAPSRQRVLNSRWQVGERLNAGGQGQVYLVTDNKTGRQYAAKIFKLKGYETKKLARAKTEIQAIKKLSGAKNVIQIYDENITDATGAPIALYYIMDRARYGSLADNDFYIGDIELSLRMFRKILSGVREAHNKGVIHRDLKPANILLYPTQRDIVITDFGLGLIKDRESDEGVTEEDELLGPRHFMAPEQHVAPSDANEQSDIYSLGKILYFMLTGKGKVYREKLDELSQQMDQVSPYIPQIQENLLNRMVAEVPVDRFNGISEILDEVDKIIQQIIANSQRYIVAASRPTADVYGVLIGGHRDEFINSFGRNLSYSLRGLELVGRSLIQDKKHQTFDSLKADLRARYKSGKVRSAIDSVFAYITSPQSLPAMLSKARYSFPRYYMARYYLQSLSFDTAHSYIEQALELESDSSLQLDYLLIFEEVSRKCTCHRRHDYDDRIILLLREAGESGRSMLLSTLGKHYLESGSKRKGLRFLEAYLDMKPYDHSVRWSCAYEYSQLGETDLSIHHYSIYMTHNRESAEVMNNLGAAYDQKELVINSVEMFRRAYRLSHSLAGANIAASYIKVGMIDQAQDLLNEIILSAHPKPYHDSVAVHLGDIVRLKKRESENLERLHKRTAIVSQHNVQSIKSLIDSSDLSWAGRWHFEEGEFTYIEDEIILEIRSPKKFTYKLEGQLDSTCLEVKQVGNEYSSGIKSGLFYLTSSDRFEGYVMTATDCQIVHGVRLPVATEK